MAKTTRPLKGRALVAFSEADIALDEKPPSLSAPPVKAKAPAPEVKAPRNPYSLHHIDRITHRKIARGRIHIEARIDLHGMTVNEAYGLLHGFLRSAHSRGLRVVLVITGKGASFGSEGALRQSVPQWFATPMFRMLVSGYEDAARNHGGGGAFYVRLRRIREDDR
ncbi:MAG: Smr/MutS family protein [Phyllobacterium sp.]